MKTRTYEVRIQQDERGGVVMYVEAHTPEQAKEIAIQEEGIEHYLKAKVTEVQPDDCHGDIIPLKKD